MVRLPDVRAYADKVSKQTQLFVYNPTDFPQQIHIRLPDAIKVLLQPGQVVVTVISESSECEVHVEMPFSGDRPSPGSPQAITYPINIDHLDKKDFKYQRVSDILKANGKLYVLGQFTEDYCLVLLQMPTPPLTNPATEVEDDFV